MAPSKGRTRPNVKRARAPATRRGLRSQKAHPSVEGLTNAVVNPGGDKATSLSSAANGRPNLVDKATSLSSAAKGRPNLVDKAAKSVTMNKPILPSKGCLGSQYFTGEEMAPRVEVSDITIPPWSINLVGLGDDCRFNHIDIPQCITYSYVSVSPHVKAVSAETAGTLLRQIAGLTSIATEQSLKARDEILRLKREKDVALRGKDEEILQLRKELEIALMNSGANSLADGKNHMNCGNGHNKNVQEKHVVGKQDLRVTGFSPFTDTEGDTSSEGKTTDVMSDSSSDDDWGVSNRERVFGWLPTNAVGWKVATRERDDTSDPPTTDRIPAPPTTDRKLVM